MSVNSVLLCVQATLEQRRLAVDLTEVIIKWEFQRAKEAQEMDVSDLNMHSMLSSSSSTFFHRVNQWKS